MSVPAFREESGIVFSSVSVFRRNLKVSWRFTMVYKY